MPASGNIDAMSEEEIQQRQQAARKHGAYAFQARGETALDQPQRSRLLEMKDQVQAAALLVGNVLKCQKI